MPQVRNEIAALLFVVATVAVAAWQVTSFASRDSRPLLPRYSVTASGAIEVPVDLLAMPSVEDDRIETVALSRQARWLHGRKVVMNGVMFATFDETGITHYLFSPETRGRGYHFGSSIPLYLAIQVSTLEGHTEDFQRRPFTVEGIFEIDLLSEDGKCFGAYHLRDARIVQKNVRLRYRNPQRFGC